MSKYSAVFALVKSINKYNPNYTYKDAVYSFTGGKHSSLTSLSDIELSHLLMMLKRLSVEPAKATINHAADPRDKQRKAIIAIFKRNGKTTQDAIGWAERQGVRGDKRRFNDYDAQQLYYLTKVAERIYEAKESRRN